MKVHKPYQLTQRNKLSPRHCVANRIKITHFSLKISFSCSVQTFMNCRALYTFIGSSIRPFMLINFTRRCSESYIMGGMTESCLICFSLFCETEKYQKSCHTYSTGEHSPCSRNHIFTYGHLFNLLTGRLQIFITMEGDAYQSIISVAVYKLT